MTGFGFMLTFVGWMWSWIWDSTDPFDFKHNVWSWIPVLMFWIGLCLVALGVGTWLWETMP